MKKVLFSIAALLTVFYCSGAFVPLQLRPLSRLTEIKSSKETRDLSAFKVVNISGGYDFVNLRAGDKEQVTIEAEGIDLDKIVTEVKDGELDIRMKKGSYHNCKIKIWLTYRSIEAINNSGSSDVVAETPIKAGKFAYNSSGSGDFKGEFEVNSLEINISGSSDMVVAGKADKQDIAISGSGDVDASKLKGSEASVAISGSGDVQLSVSRVRSSVSGSGHVSNNN